MQINQEKIPVSEKLDQVVEQKMDILYREQKVKRIRRGVIGVSSAAACFMGVAAIGMANPAWASGLPVIGHIFEQMQDKFGYPGDYSQVGTPLETEAETNEAAVQEIDGQTEAADAQTGAQEENGQAAAADTQYTKTVGDMTVTLSEIYCNGQSLNITMALKSKEAFPETLRSSNLGDIPVLACKTEETYSFNSTKQAGLVYLEGDFVDEYTYAGLMRIDLNEKNADSETIPDSFTLNLELSQIIGDLAEPDVREYELSVEEREALSDEEWIAYMKQEDEKDPSWTQYPNEHENYWYDGPWDFELEVTQSEAGCVTVEIGTANENGAGMEKLVRTPFEITMYPTSAEDGTTYFPVMLDADGMLMEVGGSGGVVDTVAVGDHDVSTVDVYLFEDTVWLDEVKGYWWSTPEGLQKGETLEDGRTFKELCDETCVYHETVEIPQE